MFDVTIVKPSAKYLILRLILSIFAIETIYAMVIIVYVVIQASTSMDRNFILLLLLAHLVKFFALVIVVGGTTIDHLRSRYYISKHHLITDRGLLSEEDKIFELKSLKHVSINQDFIGKRLHYGNIYLTFGARGYEEDVILRSITNPHHIAKVFEKYISA
jgi:membrane protein YdbS with pleckstrin-like domain